MESQRQVLEEIEPSKECRICLEKDMEEYIAPCSCRGTGQYVHFRCFQSFLLKIRQSNQTQNGDPFDVGSCTVCNSPYAGVVIQKFSTLLTCEEICGLKNKKRLVVLLFLLGNILLIAALFGGIIIFLQQEQIAITIGAVWYALVVLMLVLLSATMCRPFWNTITPDKFRLVRVQSPILVPGVLSMENLDNVSMSVKSDPKPSTI